MTGKILPQAIDLEKAVLGALMLDKEAIHVVPFLRDKDFYIDNHRVVFESIIKLFEANRPIDMLTVVEQLRRDGMLEVVGGVFAVSQLTNKIASAANIEFHARILQQKAVQREVIYCCDSFMRQAFEETVDVWKMYEMFQTKANEIGDLSNDKPLQLMQDLIRENLLGIEKDEDTKTLIPTNDPLRAKYGGWALGTMEVVGARPSMGKTALALQWDLDKLKSGAKGMFFSIETSAKRLANRVISNQSGVDFSKFLTSEKANFDELDFMAMMHIVEKFEQYPEYYVAPTVKPSFFEISRKIRSAVKRLGIQFVTIDYAQIMDTDEGKNGNRNHTLGKIANGLMHLAAELNIHICLLSQLSRNKNGGQIKEPELQDLRDSGEIEQAAYSVFLIHRQSYYRSTLDSDGKCTDSDGNDITNLTKVICAKYKGAQTGMLPYWWDGSKQRFYPAKYDEDGLQKLDINYFGDDFKESDFDKVERPKVNDQDIPF